MTGATARRVFRGLCLLTALANAGGNVVVLLFYRPIFDLLGVPLPRDLPSFVFVSGFSFTVGVLAWMVYRDPERHRGLLVVGALGKGLYALSTFYFSGEVGLHWFYQALGLWDAVFTFIFLLFLVHLLSADLDRLAVPVEAAEPGPPGGRALLLYFSLTGNGRGAMGRVRCGLERGGYAVDERVVEPAEPLFHFPFTFGEFLRIMVRAIFRRPARIAPLDLPADHPYDLIVVESQTWFVGMSAPMEAVFQDPANSRVFATRDAAAVVVCRGLWRRPEAMLVRWLQSAGARVVGASSHTNPGTEPARTFSLFLFLAFRQSGRPRWLRTLLHPQSLAEVELQALEAFGERLARRQRRSPLMDASPARVE